MELKQMFFDLVLIVLTSINRTFMELKLQNLATSQATSQSINRTFMELKLQPLKLYPLCLCVLIEPLWN